MLPGETGGIGMRMYPDAAPARLPSPGPLGPCRRAGKPCSGLRKPLLFGRMA